MRLIITIAVLSLMALTMTSCGNEPDDSTDGDAAATTGSDAADTTDGTDTTDTSDNTDATDATDGTDDTDATDGTDGACQPSCDDKVCGKDGCGGSCGSCSEDAPVCKGGECVVLTFCDAFAEMCPQNIEKAQLNDPNVIDTCKLVCEQKAAMGQEGCWFWACAVETGFCDNEENDDVSIINCGLANGWYDPDCETNCDEKQCGDNGCGGLCGVCESGSTCTESNQCEPDECVADCEGKVCGDDSCGDTCGACEAAQMCSDGQCV